MRLPFRKSEADRRAAALRVDRDAASANLTAIEARKATAQMDGATFITWTADRNAAALEVDRICGLIETLEADGVQTLRAETEAAEQRERDAARKAADDLVDRYRKNAPRIYTELLNLTAALAQQSLVATALNKRLPDNEAPIPVAEIALRDIGCAPREDGKTRTVPLWVAEANGEIVGNQDGVVSEDGVRGLIQVFGGTMRWKCLRRQFRETEFKPATTVDWPGTFAQMLRLPKLDGPGFAFDGSMLIPEHVAELDVAAAVSAPQKALPRPVQIELVPVDPVWPPADVATEADRDAS